MYIAEVNQTAAKPSGSPPAAAHTVLHTDMRATAPSLRPAIAGVTCGGQSGGPPQSLLTSGDGPEGALQQKGQTPDHPSMPPTPPPRASSPPEHAQAHAHLPGSPTRTMDGDANAQLCPRRQMDLLPAACPLGSMPSGILDSMATALDTPETPTLTATFPETTLEGWPLT